MWECKGVAEDSLLLPGSQENTGRKRERGHIMYQFRAPCILKQHLLAVCNVHPSSVGHYKYTGRERSTRAEFQELQNVKTQDL